MIRFVPWSEVGTISVSPGDNVVEVGAFELAEGADTLWVRMTNTGAPGPWPWSYGILSFKTDEGQPLGSIKAYNSFDGEVFKLGVGLPPSVRAGVLTFEPRGFNMAWIKQGNPWSLKFEAQSGGPNLTSSMWDRDPANGVITPKVSGDNLDMTPGWIKAKNLIITDDSGASADRDVAGTQKGSWTPAPQTGTISAPPERAIWTRNGSLVTVWAEIFAFSNTTGTSGIRISGLPYSLAVEGVLGSCMLSRSAVPATTVYGSPGSQGLLFYSTSQGATDQWNPTRFQDLNADSFVMFSASYMTDDTSWMPVNNASISQRSLPPCLPPYI